MSSSFENRYSLVDRALHRLAFRTAGVQVEMGDLEDRLFGARVADVELERPVFVTGLPRAGTTLLLDLLVGSSAFGAHTYRDMPFVLLPLMWDRFSAAFRSHEAPRERAHGDGVLVGPDSPEAFEEMVWRPHWRDRYRADRILPWDRPAGRAFARYFRGHLRKIVALRRPEDGPPPRYVSKNNLNIARVECLLGMLPDARVVVPVREPIQHARSLAAQHRNFTELHRRDRFGRAYMEGVGHYDFGENLRPVDFGGWLDREHAGDPSGLEWWLEYWIAAYAHLLERPGPRVHLLSYDALCEAPGRGLRAVAELLELDGEEADALVAQGDSIDPPSRAEVETGRVPPALLARARELHAAARAVSVVTTRSGDVA